jgi:chordin
LGDQFHKAGSSWHPYLPPNGFDTCAVCTCDINTLEINCPRTQCPPLECSEKVAYRPDKKACCKICPEVRRCCYQIMANNCLMILFNMIFLFSCFQVKIDKNINTEEMRDRGSKTGTIMSTQYYMANGGCKSPMRVHQNGEEWHPIVASIGEQKCINCKCKVSCLFQFSIFLLINSPQFVSITSIFKLILKKMAYKQN